MTNGHVERTVSLDITTWTKHNQILTRLHYIAIQRQDTAQFHFQQSATRINLYIMQTADKAILNKL